VERKRLHKLSPQQKSHSGMGCGLYSQTSSDMTYQHLLQLSVKILNAGYNVIVDATFLQQQQRKLFSQQAEELQIPFLIIQTWTDKQTLLQRIKDRAGQQDNVSEADQAVLENQLHNMQALNDNELKYSITIDTDKKTHLSKLWKRLDDRCHSSHPK
jgi:predicted kinase